MKRIIAIAASLIMLLSFGTAFADGLSDPLPPVVPVSVFEDLGETRAVLVDIDSGAILFSRNSDKQAKPGSLTALMTALLLMENTAPADWNVFLPALKEVNSSWSGRGNQMGLEKGDTPSRADLLYGLLLEGAADAAYTTAVLVSGSESEFVSAMNVRARELGMTGTKFDNGYGLGSGGHYTCAY
ncbi:MAG: D-alanyl-D-alanine carboxypeptidase, partial [Clostridia bacterium]|nr:D-alanyl-D-alanine carboxypeptidase [Clostridia bacterium]